MKQWAEKYPDAANWLANWVKIVRGAQWSSLQDVRRAYPHADGVEVESRKVATVFNVNGNKYRFITAIHYNRGVIFAMMFLTHAEYSKNRWKDNL
jgi:mRNA interferase HigB